MLFLILHLGILRKWSRGWFRLGGPALLLLSTSAIAEARQLQPVFLESEQALVRTLGPWPPKVEVDPSNRVSGQVHAIELGRRLFRDARLSPVGYIACVTCHQPDRSFTDFKARAHGLADLPRNTPSLLNLRLQRWFGRDGASDSLWMASVRPMLDRREFDSDPQTIAKVFVRDPELAACYRSVFGVSPHKNAERTVVNVGKALAAFQETLVTGRTPFDDFRDALMRQDVAGIAAYPASAQRGLRLFVGQANCIACHSGANFSDDQFHKVLPYSTAKSLDAQRADAGRLEGVRSLKSSHLNLMGRHNDDPSSARALETQRIRISDKLRGQFRTPSLRNVAQSPPYWHDGRAETLSHALRHGAPLSNGQVSDLSDFLATLTDPYGEQRPWSTDSVSACR